MPRIKPTATVTAAEAGEDIAQINDENEPPNDVQDTSESPQ